MIHMIIRIDDGDDNVRLSGDDDNQITMTVMKMCWYMMMMIHEVDEEEED